MLSVRTCSTKGLREGGLLDFRVIWNFPYLNQIFVLPFERYPITRDRFTNIQSAGEFIAAVFTIGPLCIALRAFEIWLGKSDGQNESARSAGYTALSVFHFLFIP